MLCQNCHLNDASVHLRRIVNGEAAEVHLCADCARSLGQGNLFGGFAFAGTGKLGELLGGTDFSAVGNRVVRCDVCGLSFDDIVRSSRPGCPNCYRVFYDKLLPSIQKMHGRALYRGSRGETKAAPKEETGEKWYKEQKNHSDIVLGSAALLTANADGIPFPARLSPSQKNALNVKILQALGNLSAGLTAANPARLYPYEVVALAERSLITPEFASAREGAMLAFSQDEKRSLMLCDENHIKIRAATAGLAPEAAFAAAAAHRDAINAAIPLAVSQKLGYLNQNPDELGTGLVSSVVMHLPVLSKTGALSALASIIAKLGLAVTGLSGSGLAVTGDLFRVSNTITLGLSEEEAISNLKSFCLQLETKERAAAERYVEDIAVQDRIQRAASLLSGAMLLTSAEMNEALSWVRLGTLYGITKFDIPTVNELIFTMQPASVNTLAGTKLSAAERDALRAKLVREKLFGA